MNTASRRAFLGSSSAALASVLASCSSYDRSDRIPGFDNEKEGMLRIDSHTHVFNGEDIDSLGYLAQELTPGSIEDVLLTPFTLLGHAATKLAKWAAPGMRLELGLLDNLMDRREERRKCRSKSCLLDTSTPAKRLAHARLLERDIREIAWSGTKGSMSQDDLEQAMKDRFRELMRGYGIDSQKKGIAQDFAVKRLLSRSEEKNHHPLAWLQTHMSMEDWLSGFIGSMCNFRIYNAVRMTRRFPDVQAFVAATLDFDEWFLHRHHGNRKNPSETIAEQSLVMAKIAILTEGQVIPRTGWCPLRQARWDDKAMAKLVSKNDPLRKPDLFDPLTVLRNACELDGSIGAKLYPVLGYRASKNVEISDAEFEASNGGFETAAYKDFGRKLDDALTKLYDVSQREGYCLMAHTNFSHGAGYASMVRAAPEHWKPVLDNHKGLRVQIGHFGGFDEGPQGNKKARKNHEFLDWPLHFADLMHADNHCYADLSMVNCKDIAFRKKAVGDILARNPFAARRLLYGTDWHEQLSAKMSYSYLHHCSQFFQSKNRPGLNEADFFAHNAVACLGLRKGEKPRARLDRFYAANHVNPAWTHLVDALA